MKKREANFELLRIIAMLMIVMLHLLGNGHGNVMEKTTMFSAAFNMTWFLEAACTVAVNCYVLLSGHFLLESQFSWKKVLHLVIEVWFYTLVFFGLSVALGWQSFSLRSLLTAITPITGRMYWFVSVYIGMYILSPFLNILIKKLTQIQLRSLILITVALFGVLPTVLPVYDTFSSGGGTGLAWFCTLYFVAAYIRLYGLEHIGKLQMTKWKWLIGYVSLTVLIWLSKLLISAVTMKVIGHTAGTSIFYQYETPLCFLSALCLFMFFKEMKLEGGWIVKLSALTFGVYIIHENPFIKAKMWQAVSPSVDGNVLLLLLTLIAIVIGIYGVCSVIEWIRQWLFKKLRIG